jgi:hypothetical protein
LGESGATVDLTSAGGVSEVAGATLVAATLQSTGGVTGGAADFGGTANAIAGLGDFTVNGNALSLSDTGALAVTGPVTASAVTIGGAAGSTPTSITLTGDMTAPTITLSAGGGGIALNGVAVLGGSDANVDLTSTGGVSEVAGATLVAATLQSTGGVTGGAADFGGTANVIGTLGGFTVTGNALSVSDTGPLSVTGPVTASAVTIGGAAGSTPTSITLTGDMTAPTITLSAGGGGIALNGASVLGQSGATVDLSSAGGVSEVAGATLIAATLQSTGGVTGGAADFSGTANAIATLGDFNVTGSALSLSDTGALSVTGPVTATAVTIGGVAGSTPTGITATGSVGAAGVLSLSAGNGGIALNGVAHLTGATVDLSAGTGGIALNGTSVLGQGGATVDLNSTGGVSEVAGATLVAATLQSTGSVTGGAADFAGTGNAIATLGGFTVTGNALSVSDTGPLSITGPVTASAVTIGGAAGSTPTSITLTGDITAPTITLSAGGGGIALNGTSVLGQSGATVDLSSSGGVSEVAGATVTAGTLKSTGGVTGGAASFVGTGNAIAGLGNFAVTGNALSLSDTGPLNVAGVVTATTVTIGGTAGSAPSSLNVVGSLTATTAVALTAGTMSIPGLVSDGGAGITTLTATTGGITEGGTLIAGLLTGSAAGAVSLPGAAPGTNQVATLGDFTAPTFALADGRNLLINAVLTATDIALTAPTSQITLGDGASIVTGGVAPPATPGPLVPAQEPSDGAPGAYIQAATFTQVGSSSLLGQGHGPATLQISTTGNVQFDPPLGLQAPNGWLILNLGDHATAGGNVFVRALNVTYGVPGSANLFGTVDGITGRAAAAEGFIQPSVNAQYQFNGCEIGAVACLGGTLPDQQDDTSVLGSLYPFLPGGVPPLIGLTPLVLLADPLAAPPPGELTDPDVIPPNVSYVDY